MEHVAVLTNIAGALAAIGAIAAALIVHQRFPQRFLSHFIVFLCLIFVAGLAELARNYLSVNLGMSGRAFNTASMLAIAAPTFFGLLQLIRFVEEVIERILRVVVGLFIAVAALQIVILTATEAGLAAAFQTDHLILALQIALLLIYQGLAIMMIRSAAGERAPRANAVRLAGVWIAAKPFLEIVVMISYQAAMVSYASAASLLSVVEMASGVIVILFVRPFTLAVIGADRASGRNAAMNQSLLDEYGVTARERQIIELVAAGLANREVADKLHISPVTVKDHIYSIYKKAGVKNRVQLANLFRV